MRVALTGGGTGGHILPALTVLEALRSCAPDGIDARFFGPENRGERALVEAGGVDFEPVPAAALHGKGPMRVARGLATLVRGTLVARRKLAAFKPDVVFGTGGYGSFPVSLAARLLRVPMLVYLPDVLPGWAVRAERHLATRMVTTTTAALEWLPAHKTTVTGYPVRRAFFEHTRQQARADLALSPAERVVVVAGATQGAHAINQAVFRSLRDIVEECTLFHITGQTDFAQAGGFHSELGPDLQGRYRVHAYRDDLPSVLLAADVAVMRAGASALGELPAANLPAILVPAGYAGGHQGANARWLADAGAAIVMLEAELPALATTLLALLDDEARLVAMRSAAAALARPQAAAAIAGVILEVARK